MQKRFLTESLMIKVLETTAVQGTYFNIMNVKYDKARTNVLLNRENLKTILLKLEMRQGCSLSPLFCNIVLKSTS